MCFDYDSIPNDLYPSTGEGSSQTIYSIYSKVLQIPQRHAKLKPEPGRTAMHILQYSLDLFLLVCSQASREFDLDTDDEITSLSRLLAARHAKGRELLRPGWSGQRSPDT